MTEPVDAATALERLGAEGLELAELLPLLPSLEGARADLRPLRVAVSASFTPELLAVALRRQALLDGARAEVTVGALADHIGNARAARQAGVDALVLWWLLDELAPALEARAWALDEPELTALVARFGGELRLALDAAAGLDRIYVALLHRLWPAAGVAEAARVEALAGRLNEVLRAEAAARPAVRLLDPAEAVGRLGRKASLTPRMHLRFKAPYTLAVSCEVARQLSRAGRGGGRYWLKVLALDADNTLWGGVVGEDGVSGVALDPHAYPGSVFWRVQHQLLQLQRAGVLLCLVSKNEPRDVDAMLAGHPSMVLRAGDFVARRVSWDDKPSSLRALARELNLGLDAFAFLDDAPFECEAVRGQLPEVRTFQVPKNLWEYPALVAGLAEHFLAPGPSADGAVKAAQYHSRAEGEAARAHFESQEAYLASLGLKVRVARNERASVSRIAELTQKSNQWNLTTRRYSEAQVEALMASESAEVWSVHVADRFGEAGLTGVVVLRYQGEAVEVEACLLSCRVIGRGVEHCIWPGLLERARRRGVTRAQAEYLPTPKNPQVKEFWDTLGFRLAGEEEGARRYAASLDQLTPPPAPHIEVTYG